MSVEIRNDNTKEVLAALERAKLNGLRAIGFEAETAAKEKTPVDTGRLRNSITFAVSGEPPNISSYSGDHGEEGGTYSGTAPNDKEKSTYLGTNVSYAPIIENRAHMLQQAATGQKERYRQLMDGAMKNA